jgi:hypothetical protein
VLVRRSDTESIRGRSRHCGGPTCRVDGRRNRRGKSRPSQPRSMCGRDLQSPSCWADVQTVGGLPRCGPCGGRVLRGDVRS